MLQANLNAKFQRKCFPPEAVVLADEARATLLQASKRYMIVQSLSFFRLPSFGGGGVDARFLWRV
jgi:hypothetical protein